jgi:O-antigen/teichoic acid export membrane protein
MSEFLRAAWPMGSNHRSVRSRTVLQGGYIGIASRLIAMLVGFALLPITIRHAGPATYGLFAAVTAFSQLLTFADLGIGNGVIRLVSLARSQTGDHSVSSIVSTALAVLTCAGVIGGIVGLGLAFGIPWSSALHAPRGESRTIEHAVIVLAVCIAAAVPGALAEKLFLASQQPAYAYIWSAVGAVAGSTGVVIVAINGHSLWKMVGAQVGLPALVSLIALRWFMVHGSFSGSVRQASPAVARQLLRTGRLFVVLQTAAVVNYEVDNLVVAHIRGPVSVTTFATTSRVYAAAIALSGVFFVSLWAAFAEATANRDIEWVRGAYRRAVQVGATVGVPISIILAVVVGPFVHIWTRGIVHAPLSLTIALSVWLVIYLVNQPQAMLLNGLHDERFQLRITAATVVANVGLSIWLTYLVGVSGPIWGTVIAQIFCALIPATIHLARRADLKVSPGPTSDSVSDAGRP